jgi:cell division protein FtsX
MKFIIVLLLVALLGFTAPLYFSWWSFAVTSFIIAIFIHQKAFIAFVSGFLGLFLLWLFLTLIIDNANQHILSQKIAQLLPLNGSSLLLILITALIGGLISGFAALSGSLTRRSR